MDITSSDQGQNSGQNSGKTKFQLLLIAGLKKEIEAARRLGPENIAAEIEKTGFSCFRCGKCCKRAFGDNSVIVLPSEIEKIREHTGLSKLEIAGPLIPDLFGPDRDGEESAATRSLPGSKVAARDDLQLLELLEEDVDSEGNIHAFGWMLRRKKDGDCVFLECGTNRCRVYAARPMLCRTYPFYMEELKLYTCECEGLGSPISGEESLKLAEDLLSRYLAELEDMLAVYEKFENFKKDEGGLELAKRNAAKGRFTFIVHDSSGVSKIPLNIREYD